MPKHHSPDHEGVAKIVYARSCMSATVDPTQLVTQTDKNPIYLAQAQGTPAQPTSSAGEERHLLRYLNVATAQRSVAFHGLHRARMHRHMPGFCELGVPYGQHARLKVNIRILQVHCFGDTKPSGRDQAKQRLKGCAAQSRCRPEIARRGHQIPDLLLAVDVRGQTLTNLSEG